MLEPPRSSASIIISQSSCSCNPRGLWPIVSSKVLSTVQDKSSEHRASAGCGQGSPAVLRSEATSFGCFFRSKCVVFPLLLLLLIGQGLHANVFKSSRDALRGTRTGIGAGSTLRVWTQISTGTANFWSGGLASFVYWGFAIPFDNIKKCVPFQMTVPLQSLTVPSRQMAFPFPLPLNSPDAAPKRPSFSQMARQIYRADGASGFYRGLGPVFLRAFPVNASAIFVYEGLMHLMGAEKVCANVFSLSFNSQVPFPCRLVVRVMISLPLVFDFAGKMIPRKASRYTTSFYGQIYQIRHG